MKKNEIGVLYIPLIKVYSKQIKHLNTKAETVKHIGKNREKSL